MGYRGTGVGGKSVGGRIGVCAGAGCWYIGWGRVKSEAILTGAFNFVGKRDDDTKFDLVLVSRYL